MHRAERDAEAARGRETCRGPAGLAENEASPNRIAAGLERGFVGWRATQLAVRGSRANEPTLSPRTMELER